MKLFSVFASAVLLLSAAGITSVSSAPSQSNWSSVTKQPSDWDSSRQWSHRDQPSKDSWRSVDWKSRNGWRQGWWHSNQGWHRGWWKDSADWRGEKKDEKKDDKKTDKWPSTSVQPSEWSVSSQWSGGDQPSVDSWRSNEWKAKNGWQLGWWHSNNGWHRGWWRDIKNFSDDSNSDKWPSTSRQPKDWSSTNEWSNCDQPSDDSWRSVDWKSRNGWQNGWWHSNRGWHRGWWRSVNSNKGWKSSDSKADESSSTGSSWTGIGPQPPANTNTNDNLTPDSALWFNDKFSLEKKGYYYQHAHPDTWEWDNDLHLWKIARSMHLWSVESHPTGDESRPL